MKHLIIGQGEIGKALKRIFKCDIRDKDSDLTGQYDIIHIAYPYFKGFEKVTINYKKFYKAKYVIIHSTVPVGTSDRINAIHSPVTGVHPHLAKSIKTFTKFVADKKIVKEFKKYGIPAKYISSSKDTEAGKLYALLIYGINVLLEKEIYEYCLKNKLNYENVYQEMVKMYNNGYKQMGMGRFQMYKLTHKKGKIGGHCVVQNSPLLKTEFSKFLVKLNNKL